MNFIEAVKSLTTYNTIRRKEWLLMGEYYDCCFIWLDEFKGLLKFNSIEELRKEDVLADDWEVAENRK